MGLGEDILGAQDLDREAIQLPKWTDQVLYVYALTGEERDDFEASIIETRGNNSVQNLKNLRAKLAVLSLRDEQGVRVFRDEQVAALGKKSGDYLTRIFAIAKRLSKLSQSDVEELLGNSDAVPSGDSTSG